MTFQIDCPKCPFYDALDSWWHWNWSLMEHVTTFVNEINEVSTNPKFQTKIDSASKRWW